MWKTEPCGNKRPVIKTSFTNFRSIVHRQCSEQEVIYAASQDFFYLLTCVCIQDLSGSWRPPLDQHWWQDDGSDCERPGASSPIRPGSSSDTRLHAHEKGAFCSTWRASSDWRVYHFNILNWFMEMTTCSQSAWVIGNTNTVCVTSPVNQHKYLTFFINTGHFLPLPEVTNIQRDPEKGAEPWSP